MLTVILMAMAMMKMVVMAIAKLIMMAIAKVTMMVPWSGNKPEVEVVAEVAVYCNDSEARP